MTGLLRPSAIAPGPWSRAVSAVLYLPADREASFERLCQLIDRLPLSRDAWLRSRSPKQRKAWLRQSSRPTSLRSTAPTVGAIVGNDLLDRAEKAVRATGIPERWRDDARQAWCVAVLEGKSEEDVDKALKPYRIAKAGRTVCEMRPPMGASSFAAAIDAERHVWTQVGVADIVPADERRRELVRRARAGAVMRRLSDHEQTIMRLLVGDDDREELTHDEIGRRLRPQRSHDHVRRAIETLLRKFQ